MKSHSSAYPTARYMAAYARRLRDRTRKMLIFCAVMAGMTLVCTIIGIAAGGAQYSFGPIPYPLIYAFWSVVCLGTLAWNFFSLRGLERKVEHYEDEARREEEASA